jgi:dolichol-phosphate mannosyltransferase
MSYSPNQIRKLVGHIDDDVDAIFGSPYIRGGRVEGVSNYRLLPSLAVSAMYSIVMVRRLACWTSIFRAIRRSVINTIEIKQDGFEGVAEIAIKLAKRGFRIVEVPAVLGTRSYGYSKAYFTREFRRHLKLLFNAAINNI